MKHDGMVSIKREKDDSNKLTECSDQSHYPYGTSVNFDDDMLEELKVDDIEIGEVVEVRGFAFLDSMSEHKDKEESNKNVRFQFTHIELTKPKGEKDVIKTLYGDTS